MDIITDLGRITGLNINWDKSMLLPVDTLKMELPLEIPRLEMINKIKYLGIYMTPNPEDYIIIIVSLLDKLKAVVHP